MNPWTLLFKYSFSLLRNHTSLKPAEMPPSFFPEKLLTSCVADNQCWSEVFATQEVNYSLPHSGSAAVEVIKYSFIWWLTGSAGLSTQFWGYIWAPSSCRSSSNKATKVFFFFMLLDKYLFSIIMKFSQVLASLEQAVKFDHTTETVTNDGKWDLFSRVPHWTDYSVPAALQTRTGKNAADARASACTLAHRPVVNEKKQRGLKMPSLLWLPAIVLPWTFH